MPNPPLIRKIGGEIIVGEVESRRRDGDTQCREVSAIFIRCGIAGNAPAATLLMLMKRPDSMKLLGSRYVVPIHSAEYNYAFV